MKVIILAGEGGTRLFPLSRADYPKYFLKVFDNTSLLMQSIMRFAPIAKAEDIIIVTGEKYQYHVRNELNSSCMADAHVILEPEFKNTVSAISLAVNYCKNELKCDDDETIFVSSSDHLISPVNVFLRNMRQGLSLTNKGKIVVFGVRPTEAATEYGYMKMGEKLDEGYIVDEFVEKPELAKAEEYVKDGKYYWNAGICVFQMNTYFQELEKNVPEIAAITKLSFAQMLEKFCDVQSISIDYGILEKSQCLAMVLLNCFWNDIGSWDDMYEVMDKDEDNNAKQGDVVAVNCNNSLFIGKKRLLAGVGLSDILAVETDDVILVAKRGQSDMVRDLVDELKKQKRQEADRTSTVFRPWGCYTVIDEGKNYKIRRVILEPGASLKMQMHYHRSEHWVVTEGSGKVVIDGQEQIVYKNQSVFVPIGAKHKLSNPGHVPLEIVEVQNGEYIGEDDIVRVEE